MKYTNLYREKEILPEKIPAIFVKFGAFERNKRSQRVASSQGIVNILVKRGIEAAVVPKENYDIVILNPSEKNIEWIISRFKRFSPIKIKGKADLKAIEKAWQNRIRIHLLSKGFLKAGDRYIPGEEIINSNSIFKRAFRIQAILHNRSPSILLDLRTRIIMPLSQEDIEEADEAGEESKIRVRVLPNWSAGILVGRAEKLAKDMKFPIGNRSLPTPEYWKFKHNIRFVMPNEEMLEVFLPSYGKILAYPKSCVFKEFKRGTSLPENLKKSPSERIKENEKFISEYLSGITFLGKKVNLSGPTSIASLGYAEHSYPYHRQLEVLVGDKKSVFISRIHQALKNYGPFAGKISGKYVVIHYESIAKEVVKKIEKVYSRLNLGTLELLEDVGERGFVDTGGKYVADYTSAISELKSSIDNNENVIAFLIVPDSSASEIYYRSREKLLDNLFGMKPLPVQAITESTLEAMSSNNKWYPICANIASQCYIKLGGTGSAIWVLKEPADSSIPRIPAGSTCYAYHDVSRRSKIKASVTAYSAMTDSYGRYIATGSKPIGGEKLTPSGFYDVLVDLLQKISLFSKRFSNVDKSIKFNFKRLVFAKDGVVHVDEAEMMEQVILNGIPEERKEPIPHLIERQRLFPKRLIIDIIGVNKSPNRRIFEGNKEWKNVREGTGISYNNKEGLLISSIASSGTARPIEISFKRRIYLNCNRIPEPHISQIMEEYHRLTYLDWASLFKQGKYALPQILTQNLGENISAGVSVPENMILL